MVNFSLMILLAVCGVQGDPDPTIKAKAGEFNYFVVVWKRGVLGCGGTIIDERHIITRGSCVVGIPSSSLSITAGRIYVKASKELPLLVERVHIHHGLEAIDAIHWIHDIAVLKLINRMVWDPLTGPAELITGEYNWRSGLDCRVLSWRHSYKGTPRDHHSMRWSAVTTDSDEDCVMSGVHLLKNEKCASWKVMRHKVTAPMNHYSGSPVVCQNTVIGIADNREKGMFHPVLNLPPYKDFIEDVLDDRKYDVNPGEINYVVSVWHEYLFKCGGIILDASHILTTGDCVQYANETNLQVIAGRTQILENDPQLQWLTVNNIEKHPGFEEIVHFDGPKFMHIKNNYAVLTLAVPLEWSPTIGPALLSNADFVPTNPFCGAYRWHNAYTVDDKVLLQLVWSQEILTNADACQRAGVDLEANEICVNSQYGQHPKNLDSSGNPVVCDALVVGIIMPNYSIAPHCSSHTSILSISPFADDMITYDNFYPGTSSSERMTHVSCQCISGKFRCVEK